MEMLEAFFDKLMTVSLALFAFIAISFQPAIEFVGGWKELKTTVSSQRTSIEEIKVNINELKKVVNDTSGVKTFDVASKIDGLENKFSDLENKNGEIMSILRDEPETLATIREINVKYDHILKNMDKVENDVKRTEDKMYADSLSTNALWWAIAMFVVGLVAPKILHAFFPKKDS
jgi:hypothetical protein